VTTERAGEAELSTTGGIAAGAVQYAVGALGLGDGVAVVAHLALGDVSDLIAACLIGAAVGAAAISIGPVPVVTDFALIAINRAIAAQRAARVGQPGIRVPPIRPRAPRIGGARPFRFHIRQADTAHH